MKGIGFSNVQKFVHTRYGHATWLKVLGELSLADRAEVEAAVAVGWYSTYLFARLLRAIDRVCGAGDLRSLPSIGTFEAELDINRILRFLIRVLHPSSIFKAETRLWGQFHDAGTWTFQKLHNGVDGTLDGWAADSALCTELSGYLVRMVEFTGGRNVTVEHPECRGTGAAKCIFQFRWS
jgi:hypothetical protein